MLAWICLSLHMLSVGRWVAISVLSGTPRLISKNCVKSYSEFEHLKNALSEEFDKAGTDNLKTAFDGHMNQIHTILK